MIEAGAAPWQVPWSVPMTWPYNPTTGMRYRGGNAMWLAVMGMARGHGDPRWMTFNQAKEQGWSVRKGERGTLVEYWQRTTGQDRFRQREIDGDGKLIRSNVKSYGEVDDHSSAPTGRLTVRCFVVFNGKQIEGIPELVAPPLLWDPLDRAEQLVSAIGVPIYHDAGAAFYVPAKDEIHLPPREAFSDRQAYYATLFHEAVGHASGHPIRLNRFQLDKSLAGKERAMEEMTAEFTALFASMEVGLPFRASDHVGYLAHWREQHGEDKHAIFRAASAAQKAMDYALELELKMRLRQMEPNLTPDAEEPRLAAAGHFGRSLHLGGF
ncbi:DUF1738 domain-containing protein [bacterium]|nr:MAG: DUF1738 domain-containing protein [bacterium]